MTASTEHPRGIHALAAAEPARLAFVVPGPDGDVFWTYGQFEARINAAAHALAGAGVGPGERVALMAHNGPEYFVVTNAAARLGAQIVPISYRATTAEVEYFVEDSKARVLVRDQAGTADGPDVVTWRLDDPVLREQPTVPPNSDYLGADVAMMNYTSGTTGRPKGIERPSPQPQASPPPNAFMRFWDWGRDDVHILTGPAYHTAPGAYAQMHLVEGATVLVMPRWDAEEFLRLVHTYRGTNSHMVPANFVRILELGADVRSRYSVASIRRILHGAAICPVPVKRQIMEVFPPGTVWEYYGASEGMGTIISPDEWLAKPGSVGRPFPGLDIKVFTDDGSEAGPGEISNIYLSPMQAGAGPTYHDAPEKTRQAYRGTHYTVGDIGWLDEDGYLFIADRRTDLIIRGGVNIYPAEIEGVLAGHPDVVDCAVLGLPDERLGHRVHAVVEARPGAPVEPEDLRRFVGLQLADYKVPATIEFVAELPREPNGKVRKRELREARM